MFQTAGLKEKNVTLSHDKIQKLTSQSVEIWVTYLAKQSTIGKNTVEIPIDVIGGPMYLLIITANVTTSELTVSDDLVDFGNILCGQRMTTYIRLRNEKEVNCTWSCGNQKEISISGDDGDSRFTMDPVGGKLVPG